MRKHRRKLKAWYKKLYTELTKCLFDHDPIHINYEFNTDEYEPEVGTILPRLRTCKSEEDTLDVVHEEFVYWFGASTASTKKSYEKIASDIWKLWLENEIDLAD